MPQIGLGTYQNTDDQCQKIIKSAILEKGYRLIDTAKSYGNEGQIGEALSECFA